MSRRSSSRSRYRRRGTRAAARSPLTAPVHHAPSTAPVPASSGGSVLGGICSTIVDGLSFGSGYAVAHRAVDAIMGPRTIKHETVATKAAAAPPAASASGLGDSCGIHSKAFQHCLDNSGTDISKCQFYLDMLNECRRSSGSVTGA